MGFRSVVVSHPLVDHKLSLLRDRSTDAVTVRRLVDELVTLLAYEGTRSLPTRPVSVRTPLAVAQTRRITAPPPLVVPVLRAGVGMLDGMMRLLPSADVGFVGMVRDEESLQARPYGSRLPARLDGRAAVVLDPMLATGGTLQAVVADLLQRGAATVTALCLLAAPEGLERLRRCFGAGDPPVCVVVAAVDERLDERGYIMPGLGDAGDRLFGSVG
jgi:uracil phosphoribosyltransferase